MPAHTRGPVVLIAFALLGATVIAVVLGRDDPGGPTATTTTTTTASPVEAGAATVGRGGAVIFDAPGGPAGPTLAAGVVMGFDARQGDLIWVVTPCDASAWAAAGSVEIIPRATPLGPGPADPGSVVVVLDPGHGGPARGVIGPSGLDEATVNLDIAERTRRLLTGSHTVDWVTGAVGPGNGIPPFGTVVLTRTAAGPRGGDYELGLAHRAAVANGVGAHALVSIHNNANHRGPLGGPGSEVFHRVGDPESARLAGLVHEELVRSLDVFAVDWQGTVPGPVARVDAETGEDYYGLLRLSEVPAVIAEGLYLSNPAEEDLLASDEVRQRYAEALYRALVRFFTTDESGTDLRGTEPFSNGDPAPAPECELPLEP
jgi:N-acetylmuramoyl-L-alanine amidase